MHELSLVKSIYKTVIEYAEKNNVTKVSKVYLQVGVLREFIPSYITKYWDYVGKGTAIEGSILYVEEIPATAKCSKCDFIYAIDPENIENACCPKCGYGKGYLLTGREVILDRIEVKE